MRTFSIMESSTSGDGAFLEVARTIPFAAAWGRRRERRVSEVCEACGQAADVKEERRALTLKHSATVAASLRSRTASDEVEGRASSPQSVISFGSRVRARKRRPYRACRVLEHETEPLQPGGGATSRPSRGLRVVRQRRGASPAPGSGQRETTSSALP